MYTSLIEWRTHHIMSDFSVQLMVCTLHKDMMWCVRVLHSSNGVCYIMRWCVVALQFSIQVMVCLHYIRTWCDVLEFFSQMMVYVLHNEKMCYSSPVKWCCVCYIRIWCVDVLQFSSRVMVWCVDVLQFSIQVIVWCVTVLQSSDVLQFSSQVMVWCVDMLQFSSLVMVWRIDVLQFSSRVMVLCTVPGAILFGTLSWNIFCFKTSDRYTC